MRESFDPVKKIHDIGGTSADFIAERNDGERPLVLCACVCVPKKKGGKTNEYSQTAWRLPVPSAH